MKQIFTLGIVCAAVAGGLLLYNTFYYMPVADTTLDTSHIEVGGVSVVVELAVTEAERRLGLSGREGLQEGTGMLFVFDGDGEWGIWMQDMLFPIDILFIAESGEIVTIAHSVSPATYPKTFSPSRPVRYVLELPAGFARAHDIVVGKVVELDI